MKYALMGLCVLAATTLSAQETFEMNPKRVFLKPATMEHTCLHATWATPEIKVKTIEVFLLEQMWYENIATKMPDWRERMTADDFDPKEWKQDGGPRMTRHRLAVVEGRPANNFIDQRAKYVTNYVEVILVDEADNRHNVKDLKVEAKIGDSTAPDAYYLPTYQPRVPTDRLWDKKQTLKLEWTTPEVGDSHIIQRFWFCGMKKSSNSTYIESIDNGVRGFLAGNDPKQKPMVQMLKYDSTAVIVKSPYQFYYPAIYAELEDGTLLLCKLKMNDKKSFGVPATEEDEKAHTLLELQPAGNKLVQPELPPKREPAKEPETPSDPDAPEVKPEPNVPEDPKEPAEPEQPEEPEEPSDPEAPEQPEESKGE